MRDFTHREKQLIGVAWLLLLLMVWLWVVRGFPAQG